MLKRESGIGREEVSEFSVNYVFDIKERAYNYLKEETQKVEEEECNRKSEQICIEEVMVIEEREEEERERGEQREDREDKVMVTVGSCYVT